MQLGKYDIHEVIGKGGFGTVYRATDRALGVERAVKIMHPALSQDAEFLERFRLEAHIAARLDHPYIVPVHDLDEINGAVFLVMKYMPGGSLKQRLANHGPLPFPLVLKLLAQMALALDHAHQQGLIHRDVKPANVLFETDDLVRLTDFGFAKVMTTRNISSSLTLTGGLIGTPPYMPPEIWRHKSVSPAVDQYSLACLFFECLTGQTLFAGESPAEIMTRHVLDGPIFPSDWPAEVPADLNSVLQKALAGNPADRFASCSQFVETVAALAGPATQSVSRPTLTALPEVAVAQMVARASNAPPPEALPTIQPAPAASPPRSPLTSAGFSQPREPSRHRQPWWVMALIILGGLGLLTICGLGGAWLLDWLPGGKPTAIVVANPTHTPFPPAAATATPIIKPTTTPTRLPTATLDPMIPPECTEIGQTWTSPIDGMVLVCVPAGDFLMGSTGTDNRTKDDERPQHTVFLDAYWIDQTEVTNAMYAKFVRETGYRTGIEEAGWGLVFIGAQWEELPGADWRHPAGPESSTDELLNHPVVLVDWFDATAYCEWAGRQLPSEAQWEKAARGVSGQIYPWGNEPPTGYLANYADASAGFTWSDQTADDGFATTAPVGSYSDGASPYLALDMAGNVLEWTADGYDENYYSSQNFWQNPTGPANSQGRVVRGGSWLLESWDVDTADRLKGTPNIGYSDRGFRCLVGEEFLPDFLMMANPKIITEEDYNKSLQSDLVMARGVVVQINGEKIGLSIENRTSEIIQQRAQLFVDNQLVPQDTLRIADGLEGTGGPYYLSWAPALSPGSHNVRFLFLTDTGDLLTYQWQAVVK